MSGSTRNTCIQGRCHLNYLIFGHSALLQKPFPTFLLSKQQHCCEMRNLTRLQLHSHSWKPTVSAFLDFQTEFYMENCQGVRSRLLRLRHLNPPLSLLGNGESTCFHLSSQIYNFPLKGFQDNYFVFMCSDFQYQLPLLLLISLLSKHA